MNSKSFTRSVSVYFFVVLLAFVSNVASAQTSNTDSLSCHSVVAFAFMNGVRTIPAQADFAKEELKRLHGEKSEKGDSIEYEVLYNYSKGFEDFVETFEQRLKEQEGLLDGRYELFFEALKGGGSWWSRIVDTVSSAGGILSGFVAYTSAATIKNLTGLFGSPQTMENYAEHRNQIDNWIREEKKVLFVAHSQGNLFANAAYSHALSQTTSESVKVVHIAPASPTLNGEHTLADLDLVINGLRAVGSVASNTDNIPVYFNRPAGINGGKDILGHGLLEIYINQGLAISNRVRSQINNALSALGTKPAQLTNPTDKPVDEPTFPAYVPPPYFGPAQRPDSFNGQSYYPGSRPLRPGPTLVTYDDSCIGIIDTVTAQHNETDKVLADVSKSLWKLSLDYGITSNEAYKLAVEGDTVREYPVYWDVDYTIDGKFYKRTDLWWVEYTDDAIVMIGNKETKPTKSSHCGYPVFKYYDAKADYRADLIDYHGPYIKAQNEFSEADAIKRKQYDKDYAYWYESVYLPWQEAESKRKNSGKMCMKP